MLRNNEQNVLKRRFFFVLTATQGAVVVGIFEMAALLMVLLAKLLSLRLQIDSLKSGDSAREELVIACFDVLLVAFILLVFPIMLTIGALLGRKYLLIPWTVVAGIRTFAGVLMYFAVFAMPLTWTILLFVLTMTLFNAMSIYSLLTVFAGYERIKINQAGTSVS